MGEHPMPSDSELVPLVHPWIDESHAPVYELTFPAETTDAELEAFCAVREEWARRAQYRVAWVVNLAGIMRATAGQRKLFSEHLKRFEPHDVAFNQGSALLVPNAFVRGIVTAVFWLKAPSFPHACFATLQEARHWAERQLKGAQHSMRSPIAR